MQQITNTNYENLPKIGYYSSNERRREDFYKEEPHIHKQGPLSGVKAGAHKLYNDILVYFPKGFSGSKNSDFYEYLSLGMVPYAIGSAMLIALYSGANSKFNRGDAFEAGKVAKCFGSGVVLYAAGKWLSKKLSRTLIHASTGVNLDMLYMNKVNELPEKGQDKGLVRVQYPGVFSSVDFYRKDLIDADSELNHDNDIYYYWDKVAKKAGYKDKQNASNQLMDDKIRKLDARAIALENINKYVAAALGVALGSQKAFSEIKLTHPSTILTALKKGAKQLWKGTDKNVFTKHAGKALAIGALVTTLIDWIVPTIGYKTNPNTMKSKVDAKKEYEVG